MKQKNWIWLFFIVSSIVVILDQITKVVISKIIPLYSSIEIIPGFFNIVHTTNKGIVFGFLQNFSWVPLIISVAIIIMIVFYYDQLPKTKLGQIFWALIIGGAIGNLIDRLILGHVVDFIDIGFWPAFNIADSAITVGIIGLVFYLWRN